MSKTSTDSEDVDDSRSDDSEFDVPEESESLSSRLKGLDFEEFVNRNRMPILLAIVGLILAGLGMFLFKNTSLFVKDKIEVINEPTGVQETTTDLIVEIAGAVEKPGVYKLDSKSRIDDLLISAGGLSADADRQWVEKYVNRAGKISDGQKLYIKSVGEESDKQVLSGTANSDTGYQTVSGVLGTETGGLVNINTASFAELDKLPGIGQVYGANIIEQRPYSDTAELLSRGVLPKATFEKIKEKITVY